MFSQLEHLLYYFAQHVHLAIFAPAVSFIEEIIPPIPSPSVMLATGSIALSQGYVVHSLILLALLGAVGKTCGASVVYYISDKVEDLLSSKISKFLGITHEQIEAFGAKLSLNWRDYVIITVLRALPVVPSSLLSVGCGLLKINFRLFVISTLIGSTIRDFIYIYLGYVGTKVAISFIRRTANTAEFYAQIIAVVAIVLFFGYLYYRRQKGKKPDNLV